MRVYQIAREFGRPHRAVLQLLRELGHQVSSHMASLTEDEEQNVREAVERQARGAPAVRPVQHSAPSLDSAQIAEVVDEPDLEEEAGTAAPAAAAAAPAGAAATVDAPPPAPPAPPPVVAVPGLIGPPLPPPQIVRKPVEGFVRRTATQPAARPAARPAAAPAAAAASSKKAKTAPGTKKPGRDREVALEDFEREMVREEIEMVDMAVGENAGVGPPLPPPVGAAPSGFEPGQLLRTVDLSAVEDAPEAPPPPQARRRAVVNVGGRQVRTLQRRKRGGPKIAAQVNQTLNIQTPISLKEFSQIVGVSVPEMLRRLITETGQITWNMNSILDEAKVASLAAHFKREVVVNQEKTAEELLDEHTLEEEMEAGGEQLGRPPVVAILGHVDHGKTSLLDKIRNSNVAAGEHGGITQHIGAFQVETESGQRITFLDTPGHAAFTAMRARGANAADIVVLVVDAGDGVMPQTEEAINHAKAAGCPIVVAMNKIDKPTANPTRLMQQLSAHGLTAEEWGGETLMCKVSALRGDGIPELLEAITLVAETMEPPLRANPTAPPKGRVIEARKDPFRGVIATLIVEEGTLRRGDTIVAGMALGRVRTMQDDHAVQLKEAPPSTPVEVFGLNDVPEAGDPFFTVADERVARDVVDERRQKFRDSTVVNREMPSLENLFKAAAAGAIAAGGDRPADSRKQPPAGPKELPVILKCDVRGSLEPIKTELEKLKHPEVSLKLLYAGLGAVTKSDVDNAVAGGAIVLGFHVLTEPAARKEAERTGAEIRHYMVIYEMIDEIRAALEQKLAPEKREQTTGHAEVRAVFASSKFGNIAGCYVLDGTIHRTDYVRIYRGGRLIYGQEKQIGVDSLKRFKDDAREVREGFECGIRISQYQDIKPNDVLEFYEIKEVQRKLA